jgi:hypothetical protein
MFEITPLIVVIITILTIIAGGFIGHLLAKLTYSREHTRDKKRYFHVDKATGIVSDITYFRY